MLVGKPMLKLRHEAGDSADRYQVYSGEVRVGAIYTTSGNTLPAVSDGIWGLNWCVRTAPVRSTASSARSRMPRPNLPPPGALGSRLPG